MEMQEWRKGGLADVDERYAKPYSPRGNLVSRRAELLAELASIDAVLDFVGVS